MMTIFILDSIQSYLLIPQPHWQFSQKKNKNCPKKTLAQDINNLPQKNKMIPKTNTSRYIPLRTLEYCKISESSRSYFTNNNSDDKLPKHSQIL